MENYHLLINLNLSNITNSTSSLTTVWIQFAEHLFNFDAIKLALKITLNCPAIATQKTALQILESVNVWGF